MSHAATANSLDAPQPHRNSAGWIRGPAFDLTLILGVAGISLGAGLIIFQYPAAFPLLLTLDLWFLGYHHVVATFTRLTFDTESFREHRFLIIWVPLILVAAILPLVLYYGAWILATMYLYWQWFHYTRQSYGISRIYQRKSGVPSKSENLLDLGVIYLPAVWGILNRSWQNPGVFLGLELRVIPVSASAVQMVGLAASIVAGCWLISRFKALRDGRLSGAHTMYLVSHMLVFLTGYILIPNIDHGWLVLNIWHNAQYLLIVWMYNNNRFRSGVEPAHKFLSTLSQTRNVLAYVAVCLLITTAVYKSVDAVLALFTAITLPLAIIVYQTINFHHYIVDAVLWKIRRPAVSDRLGI